MKYEIIRVEAEAMTNADDLIALLEEGYNIISTGGGANGGGCFIVYVLARPDQSDSKMIAEVAKFNSAVKELENLI